MPRHSMAGMCPRADLLAKKQEVWVYAKILVTSMCQ
jgi:hypothetical protein